MGREPYAGQLGCAELLLSTRRECRRGLWIAPVASLLASVQITRRRSPLMKCSRQAQAHVSLRQSSLRGNLRALG